MASRSTYLAVLAVIIIIAVVGVYIIMTMSPGTTTTTSSSTTTSGVKKITMIAKDIKFNATNPTINVNKGDTVQFTVINQDTVSHDFMIKDIAGAATGILDPGKQQTITVTFNTAGTFGYYCSVHPGSMDGNIIVQG